MVNEELMGMLLVTLAFYMVENCVKLIDNRLMGTKKWNLSYSHTWHTFGLLFRFGYVSIFWMIYENVAGTILLALFLTIGYSMLTAVSMGKPFWWVSNKGIDKYIRICVKFFFPEFKWEK